MKLRVASGSLGGRQFDAPHGHKTHPMSEKIRAAIFNMLGDVSGLTVLDAFSGSGAIAFEAVSRRAGKVYAVEKDKSAFKTIKQNMDSLGVGDSMSASIANVTSWLQTNNLVFDVIFCDPPYDDVKFNALKLMPNYLSNGGILVCSVPTELVEETKKQITDIRCIACKEYANASVIVFQK